MFHILLFCTAVIQLVKKSLVLWSVFRIQIRKYYGFSDPSARKLDKIYTCSDLFWSLLFISICVSIDFRTLRNRINKIIGQQHRLRYKSPFECKKPDLFVNFGQFPCPWIRIWICIALLIRTRIQNSQINADPKGCPDPQHCRHVRDLKIEGIKFLTFHNGIVNIYGFQTIKVTFYSQYYTSRTVIQT